MLTMSSLFLLLSLSFSLSLFLSPSPLAPLSLSFSCSLALFQERGGGGGERGEGGGGVQLIQRKLGGKFRSFTRRVAVSRCARPAVARQAQAPADEVAPAAPGGPGPGGGPDASKDHQNSTKGPPREGSVNENCGDRGKKSAKFWASHPSGPHHSGPSCPRDRQETLPETPREPRRLTGDARDTPKRPGDPPGRLVRGRVGGGRGGGGRG